MNKVELLAPAGDLERLKWACLYGADAIYLGGENYSLRSNAKNFSPPRYTASAPYLKAHFNLSKSPAGANNSILFIIFHLIYCFLF